MMRMFLWCLINIFFIQEEKELQEVKRVQRIAKREGWFDALTGMLFQLSGSDPTGEEAGLDSLDKTMANMEEDWKKEKDMLIAEGESDKTFVWQGISFQSKSEISRKIHVSQGFECSHFNQSLSFCCKLTCKDFAYTNCEGLVTARDCFLLILVFFFCPWCIPVKKCKFCNWHAHMWTQDDPYSLVISYKDRHNVVLLEFIESPFVEEFLLWLFQVNM